MSIQLNKKEIKELEKALVSIRDKKEAYKILIILRLNDGFDYEFISKFLSISQSTIRRYAEQYLSSGLETYLKVNYNSKLYQSSKEIPDWIKKQWNIVYNPQGLVHLLHRLGFTYKKTKLVPLWR